MENLLIQFLSSFFHLFNTEILRYKIIGERITGIVVWSEENEKQDFCWTVENTNIDFSKLVLLCRFLKDNSLIDGDRIILSYEDLIEKLYNQGWNREEARRCIDYLSSFEVKMVDDGKETDSFFLHF